MQQMSNTLILIRHLAINVRIVKFHDKLRNFKACEGMFSEEKNKFISQPSSVPNNTHCVF